MTRWQRTALVMSVALAGLTLAGPAAAQQQALTIDAIYHPDRRRSTSTATPRPG